MAILRRALPAALLVAGLGLLAPGCSDSSSSSSSGGAPPPGGGTGGTSAPAQGSPHWHEGDTVGNPLKTHSAAEAQFANEVLNLVNQERAAAGVPAVAFDSDAERAAKAHCEDMEGRGFFSHTTPEGWSPSDRLDMLGASGFSGVGENIAVGQSTPQAVMDAWMNSSGHRANILRDSFTHLGVGYDEDGRHWCQVFLTR